MQEGNLIHTVKHGFVSILQEDEEHLVETIAYRDKHEYFTASRATKIKSDSAVCIAYIRFEKNL